MDTRGRTKNAPFVPHPKSRSYHDCVHHMLRRRRPRDGWPKPPPPQRRRLTSGILTLKFDFFTGLAGGGRGRRWRRRREELCSGSWRRSQSSQAGRRRRAQTTNHERVIWEILTLWDCHLAWWNHARARPADDVFVAAAAKCVKVSRAAAAAEMPRSANYVQ